MALLGRMTGGIRRIIREEHLRTWDRNGGPGALLRAAMRHPVVTALVVAGVLGAILVAAFGVPPFSPLALIVLLVAPIVPWLRAEGAVHEEWLQRATGTDPPGTTNTDPAGTTNTDPAGTAGTDPAGTAGDDGHDGRDGHDGHDGAERTDA